jgi:NAD+ diphosphatase
MSHSFTSRLPLSRYEIDRDHLARLRPELFEELWADPATRLLPVIEGEAPVDADGSLLLLPPTAIPDPGILCVYLGRTTSETEREPAGTPIVAVELEGGDLASGWNLANLRMAGATMSHRDAGLLTEAIAILNWHAANRFSPRTGELTVVEHGGWVRRDPVTDTQHFPRTDPAIIVGVTDADDRILLGSNALWEKNRYSLLAGFVEPGESLEAAVRREIHEESGIHVDRVEYLGSQPWPFPASLMLGFTAKVEEGTGTDTVPDGTEILDLRWFGREELVAALGEIKLPGRTSIARAIIEEWFGAPITGIP